MVVSTLPANVKYNKKKIYNALFGFYMFAIVKYSMFL